MTPRVQPLVRRAVCASVLAVVGGPLTACSFDPFAEEPVAPTVNLVRAGRALGQAETKAMLATAPSGYAAAPKNLLKPERSKGKEVVTPARCVPVFDDLDTDFLASPATSYTTYVNSDKTYLGVGLASKMGRLVGFNSPRRGVAGCHRFTVRSGQEIGRYTAKPLSLPAMGEESVAMRMTYRSGKIQATYAVLRVQAGHNTVAVDAISVTGQLPVAAELQAAADTMLLNLSR